MLKRAPELGAKFCDKCGESTIITCPKCNVHIRGDYVVPRVAVIGGGMMSAPAFCHNCGVPYPWTAKGLEAARELVTELEGITEDEKVVLAKDLDDIVTDTPRATVAATRWKKVLTKVGKEAAPAFREIFIEIASETAKKILGL